MVSDYRDYFSRPMLTLFSDWEEDDGAKIETSKDLFVKSMRWTNPRDVDYIFLQHDTHYQTS
jgi:hypothetical protein